MSVPEIIQGLDASQISVLSRYSACDISDALLKLKVPGAGFLVDMTIRNHHPGISTSSKLIAPISTVLFTYHSHPSPPPSETHLSPTSHWADTVEPNTVFLISQSQYPASFSGSGIHHPPASNAILGDLMGTRLTVLNCIGVLVDGRIRDLNALKQLNHPDKSKNRIRDTKTHHSNTYNQDILPVWAKGISTVGAGGSPIPTADRLTAANCAIELNDGIIVRPGDIAFADADEDGVVVIPRGRLDEVVELLPKLEAREQERMEDVLSTPRGGLQTAFDRRG